MSIKVAYITEGQKDTLIGKEYIDDVYFNPLKDDNDQWIISEEEVKQAKKIDVAWVKFLPLTQINNFMSEPDVNKKPKKRN